MERNWLSRARTIAGYVAVVAVLAFCFAPTPSAPKTHRRKIVRFWHMWTAEWKDVVDRIVARFNDSQDEYEVVALSVPGQGADTKFVLGVIGGDPPDVMAQWNAVIPTWADDDLLTPLDDLMSPSERAAYETQAYPVVKKLGAYKGKTYGMSIGINMFAIYYLPQQLRAAGIDPDRFPTTLEGVDEIGSKLDKFDSAGRLTHIGWLPNNWRFFASVFGGGFYDWQAGKVVVDTPQNLRALQYLAHAHKRLGFDQVVRFTAGINENSFAGGWSFIGGAYSMTIDGQWRVEQLEKYAPNLEYRTVAVPPIQGGAKFAGSANGNFMIVPRGAKEKRGAWEFIKYWSGLMNPNVAAEFYTWGGWLPLTPAVANAPIYRDYIRKYPQFKTFVDMMPSESVDVLPPVSYQVFLSDRIDRAEDLVNHGTLTAEQALADVSGSLADELKRRKELGYDK